MRHQWLDDDDDEPEEDDRRHKEEGGLGLPEGDRIGKLYFKSRTVIVAGPITDKLAQRTVAHLLALAEDSDDPINMLISSPGGHVESGDMIHDVIKFIRPTVRTIGSGWVASAGALIFVGADRENRFCLPNTRFLIHQPSGGIGGTSSDMMIQAEQVRLMRDRLNQIFADATGQPLERIEKDTHRDFWLNTQEALDYGLLARVIRSVDELS
ncbi:MAG: ATP-dependent Clp protease proteolytic subunit [Paracoccus sp. (in: a-proteobacteria)]|jgi:ATP-dependent Clp protease, protease subunit|uniref:ATP-dependent Clp protease proteolytic subunit n=1 Tax=unclassified Paracoccus (in: a-proteobacteria) TaxID=2688777 RepID=UPI000C4D44A5|nr:MULTISPECIES: ATP-dependent Clp protease proteolytic subunit [unclassified Paracoccus (in: a-proteobacteria)]MAN56863.1 ATP-dependent Clp protease proteolytic subunit [Paracoccus sp. (in: a-proteobacteria)]MBA48537.1 ATP-dependent Clp protease proteolytic subunit [Paracoccus sp. (in: a-proteobacteria)]MCS5601598.1 ATP-dependent Clp protease proteolytic subunit [Paracoccus sp. (in: a-proteobacteria)]MDB2490560.1 ATP-dependent Clp protease proteolytic subunit [Paracoccus sp. (in: a-proteobacte|tara:strand:- start:145 stop:777 length:633 start_codon:yes stop_codon:yes gene_type:complete